MPNILQGLRTRLRYKIITPFLVLTLVVALVGYAVAFYLTARAAQEEFNNNLADMARIANYDMVNQERANLQFLTEVVFAPENIGTGAPSVADGLDRSDTDGIRKALAPYFLSGLKRPMVHLDRLIAFDKYGRTIADFERIPSDSSSTSPITSTIYVTNTIMDFSTAWFIPDILDGQQDPQGDKFAGLVQIPSATRGESQQYFATVAPVKQNDTVVGGIIIAMDINQLLDELLTQSKANIVAIFDVAGKAQIATVQPDNGIDAFTIRPDVMPAIRASVQTEESTGAVLDIRYINDVKYQFAYTKLRIRSKTIGILGVAAMYNVDAWKEARFTLIGLTIALMVGITAVGFFIARQITRPLDELVTTARAVTAGNFERRSTVSSKDEIGVLSLAFNQMTEHLLRLFGQVLAESGQRAAIVESIADGIIVCDTEGVIQIVNRATCTILGVDDKAILPGRLSDIPLSIIPEKVFGAQAHDMYRLGNCYIKISDSPVVTVEGKRLGDVYVLQDMTAEVQMDRAKTNFIATISHEMRTPLTSLRGNADMLMHGLAGPLQPDQVPMVETISQQTNNMTRLVNNMFIITGLETGSIFVEAEPISLKRSIEESLWPLRKNIKAKKLSLTTEIPADIEVEADRIQLRTILQQLVDNARVYTDVGGITVRAIPEKDFVRIDVSDTGCGIESELVDKVFDRFVRGEGSNDRPDRGIGLGLSIVQQLVEQHGGRVWVQSKPGEGSTFSFTLRRVKEPEQPEDPETKTVAEAA